MAISYSVKGAALETGVSDALVREAIRDGLIQERYWNTKQIIDHDELVRFIQSLPTEKPESGSSARITDPVFPKKMPGAVTPGQSNR